MIDWEKIQLDVDTNQLSWKDICEKYKISNSSINKAVKRGVFKSFKGKKYTYEQVLTAVNNSETYSDVFRQLNIKINGGSYNWIKKLISDYGIPTPHFTKELFAGKRGGGLNKKIYKGVEELKSPTRIKSYILTRYLVENNVIYKCNNCGLDNWLNEKIRLDVDHIDENSSNNKLSNLQFLCPNCHRLKTIKI